MTKDGKHTPWTMDQEFYGHQLEGIRYEQLLPYAQPDQGDAFKVIGGDFVTTEDGTGVVHTAPSFGADDMRVARQHNIGTLTLVDLQGRFTKEMGEFAGKYVKNEYYPVGTAPDKSVDVETQHQAEGDGPRLQSGEVRAQLPALLAHRQADPLLPAGQLVRAHHGEEGPVDRTEQDHQLEARKHRHRPLRQLAGEPTGLEPFAQSLLGHSAPDLAYRGPR